MGDEGRASKRKKAKSSNEADNAGFVTLVMSSQKAKDKLRELSRSHNTGPSIPPAPRAREPSYWRGKGIRDDSKLPTSSSVERFRRDHRRHEHGSSGKSDAESIKIPSDGPIKMESNGNEAAEVANPITPNESDNFEQMTTETGSVSLVDHFATSRANRGPSKFLERSHQRMFLTAFAHPINFHFVPDEHRACDFCTDWTMGILGLGTRCVTVRWDLEKPSQLVEIDGGHCAEGHSPTNMCISCSLDRLLIMRCHRPSPVGSRPNTDNPSSFTRIYNHEHAHEQLGSYLDHLFAKANGRADLVGAKSGPLPSCSLCPYPAVWKCCKWQERDKTKRPCLVPKNAAPTRPRVVISLLDSDDDDDDDDNDNDKTKRPCLIPKNAAPTRPQAVISLLDSDDDNDNNKAKHVESKSKAKSPFIAPPRAQTVKTLPTPSETPAPSPIPSQPSHGGALPCTNVPTTVPVLTPTPAPTPTPTRTCTSPATRPPLRGCGLHLCAACHTLVARECNGLLDKRKILSKLSGPSGGGGMRRADLEWLFEGSLLELAFRN